MGPVKGFGEFRKDASLSEPEIELIANWVEGGAPKGEDLYMPAPPNLAAKAEATPPAEPLPVQGAVTLTQDVKAAGIAVGGPVQVTARRPDGSIEPLIWVHDHRPGQPKAYYFREPVALPRGATIRADGSAATLLISASKPVP